MFSQFRLRWGGNKATVWTLTFMSYAMYHASRKIYSVIKSDLDDEKWFGRDSSDANLGLLDALFLFFYAGGLYFGGTLGDKYDARYVLTIGMSSVAACVILFGLLGMFGVRSFVVFAVIWSLNGLLQSSGWPTNVAVMGNWFAFEERGLFMGIWAGNASFGNIIGTGIAAALTSSIRGKEGWQWSLVVAGLCVFTTALFIWFLLVPAPKEKADESRLGLLKTIGDDEEATNDTPTEVIPQSKDATSPIGIWAALQIPGVIPYALAYACLKSTNYALFFWLPLYLVDSIGMSSQRADFVSMLFDAGQIVSAGLAGHVTDRMGQRSPITFLMMVIATGFLALLEPDWTSPSTGVVMLLLFLTGFFMGGPANLISGCISADLGNHDTLRGNARAMSTVAGIIDGTGSLGAAIVQYLVGYLKDHTCHCVKLHPDDPNNDDEKCTHWQAIFLLLIGCNVLACLLILPIVRRELRAYWGDKPSGA